MSIQLEALFNVNSLVAVITGGGTGEWLCPVFSDTLAHPIRLLGVGLMMTKALALNGASRVYIIGRRLEKLQEAAKLSPHNNIIPIQGDVTSKESLENIAARIRSEVGHVHLLV